MGPVSELENDNQKKALIFELRCLLSLTTRRRFEMMFKKSEEIKKYWINVDAEKLFRLLKEHKRRKD
jgi:hypothetical protein